MSEAHQILCRFRDELETFMQDPLFDSLCLDAQGLAEDALDKLEDAKVAQLAREDS